MLLILANYVILYNLELVVVKYDYSFTVLLVCLQQCGIKLLVLFYLWSKVETFETLPNQYLPCIGLGTLYQYTGDVETKNNGMVLHIYICIY